MHTQESLSSPTSSPSSLSYSQLSVPHQLTIAPASSSTRPGKPSETTGRVPTTDSHLFHTIHPYASSTSRRSLNKHQNDTEAAERLRLREIAFCTRRVVRPPFAVGMNYSTMVTVSNPALYLEISDFMDVYGRPIRDYPYQFEPVTGLGGLKEQLTENSELRCTFCTITYKGKNARAVWRRHITKDHGVRLGDVKDRNKENKRWIALQKALSAGPVAWILMPADYTPPVPLPGQNSKVVFPTIPKNSIPVARLPLAGMNTRDDMTVTSAAYIQQPSMPSMPIESESSHHTPNLSVSDSAAQHLPPPPGLRLLRTTLTKTETPSTVPPTEPSSSLCSVDASRYYIASILASEGDPAHPQIQPTPNEVQALTATPRKPVFVDDMEQESQDILAECPHTEDVQPCVEQVNRDYQERTATLIETERGNDIDLNVASMVHLHAFAWPEPQSGFPLDLSIQTALEYDSSDVELFERSESKRLNDTTSSCRGYDSETASAIGESPDLFNHDEVFMRAARERAFFEEMSSPLGIADYEEWLQC